MSLLVLQPRRPHFDDGFAVLGRILRVEDLVQFFERAVLRFDKEEVDDPTIVSERSNGGW